ASPNAANDVCQLRLSDQTGGQPANIRYRVAKRGQISTDVDVELYQGATIIARWEHPDVSETLTTYSRPLADEMAAAITDYSDLRLAFTSREHWWQTDAMVDLDFVNDRYYVLQNNMDFDYTEAKLLLHFDGADASTTFTDSSGNAHTFTANGNAQLDN